MGLFRRTKPVQPTSNAAPIEKAQGSQSAAPSLAAMQAAKLEQERQMAALRMQEQRERREAKQQRRQERRALAQAMLFRAEAWLPWRKKRDAAETRDHLEQVRQEVDKFDEDRRHPLERLLIFVFTVASYVLPVVIAVYIGWEIGDAYGGIWREGDSFSQGMHVTAFAGEIAQAMFVVAISFAARAWARNRENLWLLLTACVFFALFIVASGLAQWYVSTLHINPETNADKACLVFRIAMPALFDIGAALFLAIVNVKNLKRFLQQQAQKAEAIEQVNKSLLRIKEAQEAAKQRKEQHEQYLESLKATQGLVIDLQKIITERILAEARGEPRRLETTITSEVGVPQLPASRRESESEQENREEACYGRLPMPAVRETTNHHNRGEMSGTYERWTPGSESADGPTFRP